MAADTEGVLAGKMVLVAEDIEQSMEAGMDAHMSKPIEPDKLYETMACLINKRASEEVEQDADK